MEKFIKQLPERFQLTRFKKVLDGTQHSLDRINKVFIDLHEDMIYYCESIKSNYRFEKYINSNSGHCECHLDLYIENPNYEQELSQYEAEKEAFIKAEKNKLKALAVSEGSIKLGKIKIKIAKLEEDKALLQKQYDELKAKGN